MERRKRYLKLVAFVPAIVLVGGFIGLRAGAFQLYSAPEPQPEAPAESQPVATEQPTTPGTEGDPTFMAGSKSHRPVIVLPQSSAQPTPSNPAPPTDPHPAPSALFPPAPVFIGGSKSAPIVTFPPGAGVQQSAPPPPANPPKP